MLNASNETIKMQTYRNALHPLGVVFPKDNRGGSTNQPSPGRSHAAPTIPLSTSGGDRYTGAIFVNMKKIRIRWLEQDARRRNTLKKRRSGVIKKAEEQHMLCDVQTCVIFFSPNEDQPAAFRSVEQAVKSSRTFKQQPQFNRGNLMHIISSSFR